MAEHDDTFDIERAAGAAAQRSPAGAQPIVAILFDAVGTLLYADPPVADVYHATASRFGSRLTREQIGERLHRLLRRPGGCATTEELERLRWQGIVAAVIDDLSASATSELFAELWRHFALPTSWRLFDDVASAWQELKTQGYILGMASNFDSRLRTVVAGLPPLDRCELLCISSEIGYAKPDPRFFQAVQQKLALGPSQIVLVGDDEFNDIRGGKAAGWWTVWLDRKNAARSAGCINHLSKLLAEVPRRG